MKKFTKTIMANLFMVISMAIAILSFMSGWLATQDASPVVIKILGATGAVLSLILSTPFMKTGTWSSAGWPAAMVIVNVGYLIIEVVGVLSDYGFVGQATVSLIVGLASIAISYLGTNVQGARVVTN